MKIRIKQLIPGLLLFAPFLHPLATDAALSGLPAKHPYYLHALADLRAARWLLKHRPGDAGVSGQEDVAIAEVDAVIGMIKRASIDDGKDIHSHAGVIAPNDYLGRLTKALEQLRQVHSEVAREEDDATMMGVRNRAIGHIDAAIHATERAIANAQHRH